MKYKCSVCGYIYDDDKEKAPFDSLPDTWCCPLCGAPKKAFEPIEEQTSKPKSSKPLSQPLQIDSDMQKMSLGQLSILFSNLARGCEKQYKAEEAELFREIADYFNDVVPTVKDGTIEKLSDLLKKDIDSLYPMVKATSEYEGDRGAQRVCVWGDKVTRMLSMLVDQYLKEGDDMLKGKEIWVCTVCGFVYVGDSAPELCPVCKVPSWKFEKIEGRA